MEFLWYKNIEYVLKMPNKMAEKNPAIIFLHGAGTLGGSAEKLQNNPFFAAYSYVNSEEFPFIVFAPHCKKSCWFDVSEQLQDFVRFVASQPNVDNSRIYLTGNSMGGYGTWQLAMTLPEYFAAIIPICGGGMYWNAPRLNNTPVWAVHGENDTTVLPEESIKMIDKLKSINKNAKLTILPDTEHNSWDYVWKNKMFFDWLLSFKKQNGISTEITNLGNSKNFG